MKITDVSARQILASRGSWTIETTVVFEDGSYGIASVPAGVSTGKAEAKTVPAEQAASFINNDLKKEFVGKEFGRLKEFDDKLIELDGTTDKSKLGGNSLLSLSIAFTKAAAMFKEELPVYAYLNEIFGQPLAIPQLLVLVLEGGMHARSLLTIQEFLVKCQTVEEGLAAYQKVVKAMETRNFPSTVGFEGAFSPPNFTNEDALMLLTGLFGPKEISLDVADSHLLGPELNFDDLISKYAPFSLEDIYSEEAWDSWEIFNKNYSSKVLIIADDLVVTNKIRLQKLIEKKAAGAVIVKPNQVGTVTETLDFVKAAKEAGLKVIVSHRGEETNDDFIADLAVAVGADFVKFGGLARGERLAKYNRLLEIIEQLK